MMGHSKRKSSAGRFVSRREAERHDTVVSVERIPAAGADRAGRVAYRDAKNGQFIAADDLVKKLRTRNLKAREILKDR